MPKQQEPTYDKPDFVSWIVYALIACFLFLLVGLPIIEWYKSL